ncbi:hypothetical protein AGMMS4956_12550 [Bacteroidia bacterium]|nr:hypothetical protein AGMMS4956_12550 [Bacteroidia bacterium]
MKKVTTIVLCLAAVATGCKEEDKVTLVEPSVWTVDVSNVSKTTANVTAAFYTGGHTIVERGFCYNTIGEPTLSDSVLIINENVTVMSAMSGMLRNLRAITTYYIRAYIKTEAGKIYYSSHTQSFITEFVQATTSVMTSNASYRSALSITAFVVSDEETPIIKRGVVVSPSEHQDNLAATVAYDTAAGIGEFTILATGLTEETPYYVWTFAETASEGRVYSFRSWQISTTNAAKPIVGAGYRGAHRVTLNVNVTEIGAPDNTITETGIIWAKTSKGLELDSAGVSQYADARLQNSALSTVAVVAAGLEANSTYYFRTYAKKSNGQVGYSAAKSYATRAYGIFDPAYNVAHSLTTGLTRTWVRDGNNCLYYTATVATTNMTAFQTTQREAITTTFAADRLRFDTSTCQILFVFQIREATSSPSIYGNRIGDTTLLCALQYAVQGAPARNGFYRTAYFGWKASFDATHGILTLWDFRYEQFVNNSGTITPPLRAIELMDGTYPNVQAALTNYFTWLTGMGSAKRRILIDHMLWDSWGNPYTIMMPLDEGENPDFNYLRFYHNSWGQNQCPIWQ